MLMIVTDTIISADYDLKRCDLPKSEVRYEHIYGYESYILGAWRLLPNYSSMNLYIICMFCTDGKGDGVSSLGIRVHTYSLPHRNRKYNILA